uniref:Uncharacterized protein n=1 Tax=Glossina pallidipes TaxID=7398 RepID=A0A1B0A2B7_GLOPL
MATFVWFAAATAAALLCSIYIRSETISSALKSPNSKFNFNKRFSVRKNHADSYNTIWKCKNNKNTQYNKTECTFSAHNSTQKCVNNNCCSNFKFNEKSYQTSRKNIRKNDAQDYLTEPSVTLLLLR